MQGEAAACGDDLQQRQYRGGYAGLCLLFRVYPGIQLRIRRGSPQTVVEALKAGSVESRFWLEEDAAPYLRRLADRRTEMVGKFVAILAIRHICRRHQTAADWTALGATSQDFQGIRRYVRFQAVTNPASMADMAFLALVRWVGFR